MMCLFLISGDVAQLGERFPCTEQVVGSIPISSTIFISEYSITVITRRCQRLDIGSIPITRSNYRKQCRVLWITITAYIYQIT